MSGLPHRKARSFRISGCTCHGIHIHLLDEQEEVFATASFSPEIAREASANLAEVAAFIESASEAAQNGASTACH